MRAGKAIPVAGFKEEGRPEKMQPDEIGAQCVMEENQIAQADGMTVVGSVYARRRGCMML